MSKPNPFNTNPARGTSEPTAARLMMRRMKVLETYPAATPGGDPDKPYLLRCRTWDGVNQGSKDIMVCRSIGRRVGAIIYAYQPEGGTGRRFNLRSVEWMEMVTLPPNPRKGDVLICVDDNGTLVWDRPRFTNVRVPDRFSNPDA